MPRTPPLLMPSLKNDFINRDSQYTNMMWQRSFQEDNQKDPSWTPDPLCETEQEATQEYRTIFDQDGIHRPHLQNNLHVESSQSQYTNEFKVESLFHQQILTCK
ncbi:hypothetical protein CLU79DRAFT_741742 [Phycomyces nitens]|nr:hypothetical protein CLU79DRAFT_741742 [Phycomyces nitens]